MDVQVAVVPRVIDKALILELGHEKTDPASSGANHFCQSFLVDPRNLLRPSVLPVVRQRQQQTSQTLLAVVEEMVH